MKSLSLKSLFKTILTVWFLLLSFSSYSQYCSSSGNMNWDDGITYVSFNTIANADVVKNSGYEDFTSMSTDVYKGSAYNLTVHVNTEGKYTNYTMVWIDWNGDGVFNTTTEEYDMGSAYWTDRHAYTDQSTSNSPRSITVPLTAVTGSTRMRVSTKFDSYPSSSCDTTSFDGGEVEDYTIIIKEGSGVYCSSSGNSTTYEYIGNIKLNDINNSSGAGSTSTGYSDFTYISTNLNIGSNHTISITPTWPSSNYSEYYYVWIDYNNNGDFTDPGEQVFTKQTSATPVVGSFTIPGSATIGSVRMRVIMSYNSVSGPCGAFNFGEVEDYTINIIGNLIDFNGSDGYVDFADSHDLTGSFSLESWVFQESSVATGTIISKGNIDASNKTGYHFSIKNNYPNLIWYGNSNNVVVNLTSPYAIPNNEWHHIAATFNGSTVKLYVDGIEVNSKSASSSPRNTVNDFIIGADTKNYTTTPSNNNYFDGAIQEVRIWNVALSESQIRDMMNQHIEQNGTNVKGSETKLDISGGLLWSNLLGYYPLDSNTALDSSGYNIDGMPQNMMSSQIVTAPLPYKTNADSTWDISTTWLNNSDVYIPNTIGVDGTTSIDWNIVELSNNVTSGDRNITLNGLVSTAGTLTIDGVTNMTTGEGTGHSLTITNYLELDGVIDLQGESQLIQTEGSILDADSGGYIERDQQGTANGFNYNYWSSSVGPIAGNSASRGTGVSKTNTNYTISGVMKDGTTPSSYKDITFNTSAFAADSDTPTSPITISSYWLLTFYGLSDDYNSWTHIDETIPLSPGEGYTMKGSSGSTSLASKQNYVFKGLPNNGDITLPLNKISGTVDVDRLIGNPYPSAIDVSQFILDNMSIADGGNNVHGTIFNGAVYFWNHFGEENTHYLKGYVGGYATRNLTAGVPAISNDSRINSTSNAGSPAEDNSKVPGPYIPVNQGFFVSTSILPTVGGDIVFNNGQRVFATEDGATSLPYHETSLFFKSSNNKKGVATNKSVAEKQIIRLQYDSPLGYHRQLVIGAINTATNKFDMGYDAFMVDENEEDMYWTLDNDKFVIQGVNNFDDTEEFPLGLIVNKAGMASINLYGLENVDASKPIYIKDTSTDETYQINDNPFEIYLEAGTYNDRFKLVFQAKQESSLATNEADLKNKAFVYYDSKVSELKVTLLFDTKVINVMLFNLLGQKINFMDKQVGYSNEITIPIHVTTGAYMVQINTTSGIINKKIVIK